MIPTRLMIHILAALALLLVPMPAVAQVWKGEVPDAAKVAALKNAAAKGDPAAMADVAYLSRYCRGGVKYDPKLIFEYSRKSAMAGNAFGMYGLSYCYMQGCGVDADDEEAHRWAKKSADMKHPCGLFLLGVCYGQGLVVATDRKHMVELYQEAAGQGSINARQNLLSCYDHGTVVKQDRDRAFAIADELVREHDWMLGALMIINSKGGRALGDAAHERAIECVLRYAALGNPQAIHGLSHFQREHGMLDDENFLHHIIEAARLGNCIAYRNLNAFVDNKEHSGYDLPIYSLEGTFHDLGVLAVARGLDVHTDIGNLYLAVEAFANGGDVCPRNLEAARAIVENRMLRGAQVAKSHDHLNLEMAYIYMMGVRFKVKGFDREDLAVAHALYDNTSCSKIMKWLQWFHRGYFPGFHRDIAKAYVTAKLAHEMKDEYTVRENIVKRIEVQLKEADWKEIKRLQDDGYPTAPKFKEEARKLILASGFKLPEEKPEAGPENENLKQ